MHTTSRSLLRRILSPLFATALLAGAASATWSIVVVDTATREVCVASATCLSNFDLERWLPVLRVGQGAAAAQSAIDTMGTNRSLIWARMGAGVAPRLILIGLRDIDPQFQSRQYGIVTLEDLPASFTGTGAGLARHGVTGHVGSLVYAIQGNVLTGNQVVLAAEAALRDTPGDLGQRVMAGMEAARTLGGDGRCSCSPSAPTSCGVPPPSFTQSSRVAFIVLGRLGDVDGVCNTTVGCASGQYYLDLQRITDAAGPDPVLELESLYAGWRANLIGRPDHILSQVELAADSLVADGLSEAPVLVRLIDVDGNPLMSGGATISVQWTGSGAPVATPGPVTDHGDGTYSFGLQATSTPGPGSWSVTVNDGVGPVLLHAPLELRVDPLAELHAGVDAVSISEGADAPFVMNLGAPNAQRPFILLGSLSGTLPGQDFHGIHLALNHDDFFVLTLTAPGSANLPGSIGRLDALGRAEARFVASPAELAAFGGSRFDWLAVLGQGAAHATNGVGFDVVP